MSLPITTVVINYQTPDLTCQAVESFRSFYPDEFLLLIDNGSRDDSASSLRRLQLTAPNSTFLIENKDNCHHGPAMHQGMQSAKAPYVFFIDSDCIIKNGGFLERMSHALEEHSGNYVIGKRIFMNRRGFDIDERAGAKSLTFVLTS